MIKNRLFPTKYYCFIQLCSVSCLSLKALLIKPTFGLITHEYILLTDTYSQRRSALIIPGPIFFLFVRSLNFLMSI